MSITAETRASGRKVLTLMLVEQGDRVLLGVKKRGFGVGKYNGFGGKVEAGESIAEAAKRELHEEAGIEALEFAKAGMLDFDFVDDSSGPLRVHVFRCAKFAGEVSGAGVWVRGHGCCRGVGGAGGGVAVGSGAWWPRWLDLTPSRPRSQPRESEEMTVQWTPKGAIPFDKMWQDDRHWFPLFLASRPFLGHFVFRGDTLLEHKLQEVDSLDVVGENDASLHS